MFLWNAVGIKVQFWGVDFVPVKTRGGRLVGLKNRRAIPRTREQNKATKIVPFFQPRSFELQLKKKTGS